jgi:hypothetical protein
VTHAKASSASKHTSQSALTEAEITTALRPLNENDFVRSNISFHIQRRETLSNSWAIHWIRGQFPHRNGFADLWVGRRRIFRQLSFSHSVAALINCADRQLHCQNEIALRTEGVCKWLNQSIIDSRIDSSLIDNQQGVPICTNGLFKFGF